MQKKLLKIESLMLTKVYTEFLISQVIIILILAGREWN